MTLEIDAFYKGEKVQPLDPCEDCAAKEAEIARLRQLVKSFSAAVERNAFAMPAPNIYTPIFVQLANTARCELTPNQIKDHRK